VAPAVAERAKSPPITKLETRKNLEIIVLRVTNSQSPVPSPIALNSLQSVLGRHSNKCYCTWRRQCHVSLLADLQRRALVPSERTFRSIATCEISEERDCRFTPILSAARVSCESFPNISEIFERRSKLQLHQIKVLNRTYGPSNRDDTETVPSIFTVMGYLTVLGSVCTV
jgi:hypothetical protein